MTRANFNEDQISDALQSLLVKVVETLTFLSSLEHSADMPAHHAADICQFRCEVLQNSSHDDRAEAAAARAPGPHG